MLESVEVIGLRSKLQLERLQVSMIWQTVVSCLSLVKSQQSQWCEYRVQKVPQTNFVTKDAIIVRQKLINWPHPIVPSQRQARYWNYSPVSTPQPIFDCQLKKSYGRPEQPSICVTHQNTVHEHPILTKIGGLDPYQGSLFSFKSTFKKPSHDVKRSKAALWCISTLNSGTDNKILIKSLAVHT